MNAPPSEIVHTKNPRRMLTGKPQDDAGVFLSLLAHEVTFCERALADGRSDGVMNAVKAMRNYLVGAVMECTKLGVTV
jgi:hypothetical protein